METIAHEIPAVVLAQAWRGGPQARLSRVLKSCDIVPDDESVGRAAATAARHHASVAAGPMRYAR